jgi:cytochrome P450
MTIDVHPAPSQIDLGDKDLYAHGDPASAWAELRRHRPVHWNTRPDGTGFWAITRYHDSVRVLKDHRTFTSEFGMLLDHNPAATAAAAGKLLIVTDGTRHAKIRKMINTAFTPRMVARLTETMKAIARAEIGAAMSDVCDFTEVAAILPMSVICDMLGMPQTDWKDVLECTRIAFGISDVEPMERLRAHAKIMDYCQDMADFRREHPGDDVITAMANGTVDGVPLSDEEILLNCDGIITGGNETTRQAIVGGLMALMANHDQWQIVSRDPEKVAPFSEEVLRYTSPALHVLRTPREDVEIGGQQIRANEPVAVWLASANRDEAVFRDPDRFDVTRGPNTCLPFGIGPHYCLGASLARSELQVFFTELSAAVSAAEPAGPVRRLASNIIWGFESVPVRLHGTRGGINDDQPL